MGRCGGTVNTWRLDSSRRLLTRWVDTARQCEQLRSPGRRARLVSVSRPPMPLRFRATSVALAVVLPAAALAQAATPFDAELARRIDQEMPKVVAWRRDFH